MRKIILSLAISVLAIPAVAQNFNSAYFLDGYKYRHRLNPAFAATRSYFALPAVGNISLGTQSKLGIGTFLYPVDGQLATFMHPDVSASDFLGKLNKNNIIALDLNTNLFTVGAWGKKGFTTVELNLRSSTSVNLPRDLFDFMKNLGAKSSYDISNLGLKSMNYVELALGHSHQITEHLNIGAKLKVLAGLASADLRIDKMNITMNEDKWSITSEGSLKASVPMLEIPVIEGTDELDFGNIGFGDFSIDNITSGIGMGLALDLGAEYRFGGILKGLNISAALLDLGFMSWGTNAISATTGSNSWEFTGFDNISFDEGDENTIGKQFEAMGDDLLGMIKMNRDASGKRYNQMLTCTVNLGAEYEMPFYRKMSVGFLYSSRIAGPFSKNEGRFFFNLSPAKWFGLSASYGASNFGSSLGAIINFDLPGIGLFVGTDYAFWNVTPPIEALNGLCVPYNNMNLNVNFGLTFNVSRYRTHGDWR